MLVQRIIVGALVVTTGACVSLGVSGGVHAPASGMATRVVSGDLAFGAWFPIRRQALLELDMGYELGPLGKHSNALFMGGARLTSKSHGWHPGYYGSFIGGFAYPNDLQNWDAGPTGNAVHASFGVAWTSFAREDGVIGPTSFGSILCGFAYHHQDQSNIGQGDFIGLEVTFVGGADFADALSKWEPKD